MNQTPNPTDDDPSSQSTPPAKKKNRARSLLIYGALFFVVFMAVSTVKSRSLLEGQAPQFEAFTLQGPYFSLAQQQDKPTIVHFWATWCPVCKAEEGTINSLAEDTNIITIAMQSGGPEKIAKHMRDRELNFPVIVDSDGSLARRYKVRGVPTTYILDKNGEIRFRDVGYATEIGIRGKLWMASRD